MPGFDGTGPRGMGPMSGGGRGFCGIRRVRVSGRGAMASRFWGVPYGSPTAVAYDDAAGMTTDQEMEFLRSQAQAMSEQLEQIQRRLQELESK